MPKASVVMESTVTVPCGREAQIMVVNPSRPSERRRLTVEADLVAAAARTGLGELSVAP